MRLNIHYKVFFPNFNGLNWIISVINWFSNICNINDNLYQLQVFRLNVYENTKLWKSSKRFRLHLLYWVKMNLFKARCVWAINRYRRGLETCPQAKTSKSGHAIFFSFFRTRPSDECDSAPSRKYSRPLLDVFTWIGYFFLDSRHFE